MLSTISTELVDQLRYFCIVQALSLVILVILVNRYYFKYYNKINPTFPKSHIILISLSYGLAMLYTAFEYFERLGGPIRWQTPLFFFVYLLGIIGILSVIINLTKRAMQSTIESAVRPAPQLINPLDFPERIVHYIIIENSMCFDQMAEFDKEGCRNGTFAINSYNSPNS